MSTLIQEGSTTSVQVLSNRPKSMTDRHKSTTLLDLQIF